jgi:hypothetical protein
MAHAADPAQRVSRRLASTALAFDLIAIVPVYDAAFIDNSDNDRAITIATYVDLICPFTASLIGLCLALSGMRRAEGWRMVLPLTAVTASALLLVLALARWMTLLQDGGHIPVRRSVAVRNASSSRWPLMGRASAGDLRDCLGTRQLTSFTPPIHCTAQ